MKRPDALQLANWLDNEFLAIAYRLPAAAELRRLHAANAELVEALEKLLDECDIQSDDGQIAFSNARASLAKHKGEQA